MIRRGVCALFMLTATIVIACNGVPLATVTEESGAYVVLEVDAQALQSQQLENIGGTMAAALREADPPILYADRIVLHDAARLRVSNPNDLARARVALRGIAWSPATDGEVLTFSENEDGSIEARFTPSYLRVLAQQAAAQSIEVIRRRVDPTGTAHVSIAREGDLRIVVRTLHLTDLHQLRRSVGITAQLSFHLVEEAANAGASPTGTMVAQPFPGIGDGVEIVETRPRFTGERLARAHPATDSQTGEFVLAFQLDAEGMRLFCRVTRDHIGDRFAILLDGQVLTAPRIHEPICGGAGQISGGFTAESANELAILLSAGALPAPLRIVEEGVGTRP